MQTFMKNAEYLIVLQLVVFVSCNSNKNVDSNKESTKIAGEKKLKLDR